jgi:L-arabinose isomerase
MFLQGAYHNVFAFRFEDLYGLEAGPVLAELDKLTVAGIGPELEAPAP